MSTATPVQTPPAQFPSLPRDIKVYSHTNALYWWPVWFVGLAMAVWTGIDNYHMLMVPRGTTVAAEQLTLPQGGSIVDPIVHVARSPVPGAIFVTTLLGVVIFSHLTLRGVWSLLAAACLLAGAMFLSWMHWWDELFAGLLSLRVYLNLGAYLVISVPMLILWLIALFILDRRTYLVFSVGQVRIRDELGDEERAFDTNAVAFEKKPSDWFRWLVGCGAGDLIVRIGGPQPQTIELTNVIGVGSKMDALESRLRMRDVV